MRATTRSTFDTTDVELARGILSEHYARMRLRLTGDRPRLRMTQDHLGRARLDDLAFDLVVTSDLFPLARIVLVDVLAGRAEVESAGQDTERFEPGAVFCPMPPGKAFTNRLDDLRANVLDLDPGVLGEVAGNEPDDGEPVRLLGHRPVSAEATAQWRQTFRFVRERAQDPEVAQSPLLASALTRLLAAATLTAFPNSARLDPTVTDRRDAHPETVRRAVAFIEAHPNDDIAAADIAAAAGVTVRAVQLAFRRHLGTTPMAYLRRARLDLAHRDLQLAEPGRDTVTAIAARYGFADPSRFAALYRAAYGRQPSDTLRA